MKITCLQCGKEREIKLRESAECYQKRRPFCISCGHINRVSANGGHPPNWKGGVTFTDFKGYVRTWSDVKKCYVKVHRQTWEDHFGPVPDGSVIHHRDGDKQNNSIENLECMSKQSHDKLNPSLRVYWQRHMDKKRGLLCAV